MSELFKVLCSISLSGSILILLILLIRVLFREYLSAKWHYYIWLLVIVRLLLFVSPWPGAAGWLLADNTQFTLNADAEHPEPEAAVIPDKTVISETAAAKEPDQAGSPDDPSVAFESPQRKTASLSKLYPALKPVLNWLWIPWTIIAIAFFIRKVTIYQSFQRYIYAGRQEPDDPEILNLYSEICERLSIKRIPQFYINPLIASPIFTGILKPSVFLPGLPRDEVELELILMHELTHYKHKDTWLIWIVQFVLALHWFNPLVHLMADRIRQDREFACDAAVIGILQKERHYTYGEVLIKSLENSGTYRESAVSVALHESAVMLKQRLEAINHGNNRRRGTDVSAIIFTTLICITSLLIGSYRPELTGPATSLNSESRQNPDDSGKPPGPSGERSDPSGTQKDSMDEGNVPSAESAERQFVFSAADVSRLDISQVSGALTISAGETGEIIIVWEHGTAIRPVSDGDTLSVRGSDDYEEEITIYLPQNNEKSVAVVISAEDGEFLLQDISLDYLEINSYGADLTLTDCKVSGELAYTGNIAGFKANRLNAGSCSVLNEMGEFTWKEGIIAAAAEFEQDSGGEMLLEQIRADHISVVNELGELNMNGCTAATVELNNESNLKAKLLNAGNLELIQNTGMMDLKQVQVAHNLNAFAESGTIKIAADISGDINLGSRYMGKLELSLDTPRTSWSISASSVYENSLSSFFLDDVMTSYPYQENEQTSATLTIKDENSVGQFIKIKFKQE